MKILPVILAATSLSLSVGVAAAGEMNHRELIASVATYKPMQGFNHVVGEARFVGYFETRDGRCDVTVLKAVADDDRLAVAPVAYRLDIAAGGRDEMAAGQGDALAIACGVDADAIVIAPQHAPSRGKAIN